MPIAPFRKLNVKFLILFIYLFLFVSLQTSQYLKMLFPNITLFENIDCDCSTTMTISQIQQLHLENLLPTLHRFTLKVAACLDFVVKHVALA